jgi:hypothetical protein
MHRTSCRMCTTDAQEFWHYYFISHSFNAIKRGSFGKVIVSKLLPYIPNIQAMSYFKTSLTSKLFILTNKFSFYLEKLHF